MDLVVVEFTFNESPDLPYTTANRRGFEQLLRKLLRMRRAPAVIMLHHYAWYFSDGDGVEAGLFYRPAEAQLGTMAQVGAWVCRRLWVSRPKDSVQGWVPSAQLSSRHSRCCRQGDTGGSIPISIPPLS